MSLISALTLCLPFRRYEFGRLLGACAHPEPFALGRCDLVPDAFCRDLAFELSKAEQCIQCETTHAGGCVEALGH